MLSFEYILAKNPLAETYKIRDKILWNEQNRMSEIETEFIKNDAISKVGSREHTKSEILRNVSVRNSELSMGVMVE